MEDGSTPGEGTAGEGTAGQDAARAEPEAAEADAAEMGMAARRPPMRPGGAVGPAGGGPDFGAQYGGHSKDVFREAVNRDLGAGGDAAARAREYAERGKPDFVLAFLLAGDLPDAEKRALYARSFERRAQLTEERADDFDRRFHRPFPLLRLEATKDRATARRIREGGGLRPGLGRPLPTL